VPLTPSQEIRAYAAMTAKGGGPDMIARAFAVTTRRVKQRIALSNLSDATLDELSAGNISLDVAKALTLAPSQPREIELLGLAIEQKWGVHSVHRELERNVVKATDRRAKFIGLDTYRAAGGTVVEDLFGDHTILTDKALLDKLFSDRLTVAAEGLRGDWKWAEPIFDFPYVSSGHTENCTYAGRTPGELTDADQTEYDRLADLQNGGGLDTAAQDALAALQTRADGDWTDDEYDTHGIFVFVNQSGEIAWEGAFLRDADKAAQTEDSADTDNDAPAPREKPTPQNAADDFRKVTLAAAQTAALGKHDLLLYLLAYQMEHGHAGFRAPLTITFDRPGITPEKDSGLTLDPRLTDPETNYDAPDPDAFDGFMAKGPKHRNAALTRGLARCLASDALSDFQADLIRTLAPAPRKIWTPDADNCFKRLSPAALDRIWTDLVPSDKAEALDTSFARMNKGQKARELEKLFSSADYRELLGLSRAEAAAVDAWLPAEMQPNT
jgi:ParB family chromosome partitioning protein